MRDMPPAARRALTALCLTLAAPAAAEPDAMEGDPEYGAYLAGECTGCHQASGADEGIPGIAGWPPEAFFLSMDAYRSGAREHPVMNMVAGRLGDEEIAALAAHFATLGD